MLVQISLDLYSDWDSNPVLITIETTDYPVEKIPFPTLTICREDSSPNRMQLVAKLFKQINFPQYCQES